MEFFIFWGILWEWILHTGGSFSFFFFVWYPEATLEFQNNTSEPRQWCLSSFAPTYVKQDSGEIYRATYSAFRFTRQYGNLEPGQNITVGSV